MPHFGAFVIYLPPYSKSNLRKCAAMGVSLSAVCFLKQVDFHSPVPWRSNHDQINVTGSGGGVSATTFCAIRNSPTIASKPPTGGDACGGFDRGTSRGRVVVVESEPGFAGFDEKM